MAQAGWPNLFLVGVVKGGTSSLWAYLDQHPDIFMSPVKEPHFFTNAHPVTDAHKAVMPSIKDEQAYLQLFAGAHEKIRGEASVSYFGDSSSAPAIKRASPEAKILVILRNPVERAYSHYWDAVQYGKESRTFREAVQRELTGHRPPDLEPYVKRGFYTEPLRRYLRTFGESVHVVFLEKMMRNPQQELRGVFDFLGVDADVADRLTDERRNTFALPHRGAGWLIGSSRMRSFGRLLFPRRLRPHVERLLLRRGEKPAMDRDVRRLLQEVYEPDREPLEQLVGCPVPWAAGED